MSTITFPCTSCGQVLSVAAATSGKKCKCIKCGTILSIPQAAAVSPSAVAQQDIVEQDPPRRKPRDDDEYEPRARRRRRDDDDDEPRGRDDDDRGRGRRGREQSIFAVKGLNALGMVFMFAGVGLMALHMLFIFFPWLQASTSAPGRNMPLPRMGDAMVHGNLTAAGLPALGITTWQGIIAMILAVLSTAFVMVSVFVLDKMIFKISLWSGFGCGLLGGILALLCAVLAPAGATGAWGAWVSMPMGLLGGGMFLATVLTMQSWNAGKRRSDWDDDFREKSRRRRDEEDLDDRPRSRRDRDPDGTRRRLGRA